MRIKKLFQRSAITVIATAAIAGSIAPMAAADPISTGSGSIASAPSYEFVFTTKGNENMVRLFPVSSVQDFLTTDRPIDLQPGSELRARYFGDTPPNQWNYYRFVDNTYFLLEPAWFVSPLCAFGHCHQLLQTKTYGGSYPADTEWLSPR